MNAKQLLAMGALAASLGFASSAQALPSSPTTPAETGITIQKVHGCHRSCERGPRGWHRHGLACRPIACVPAAPRPHRCWVDWRGVRYCRW